MDDDEYVSRLLAILTNPDPPDVDPDDYYGRSSDGIDRHDGFGTELRVESLTRVPGPYGDELEVGYVLELPPTETRVPARATTRLPFDAEWRRLSGYDDPAAYAPVVAERAWRAGHGHVVRHRDGHRPPVLPEPDEAWRRLLALLAEEGTVEVTGERRADVRTDDGRIVTVVVEPGQPYDVPDQDVIDPPLIDSMDDDEHYLVAWEGRIQGSTREALPPVRGRAMWRWAQEVRARHPEGGWYAYSPRPEDGRTTPDS